ncbi:CCA tRNA nucleotidyltransferase [Alsobacter soli]|uniref:CCA tRNA nucleotidyltransferase n=1 Tax=Alsobacter soli TaxID=2109933 RepID=A0A2T1HYV8_9HYPH|nr:CCA tRNA nucleotidyltransferase [Alsobacter soli]PSC06851.1 CCA tRNA nucleotidyltransferase [Alsobacter soli]
MTKTATIAGAGVLERPELQRLLAALNRDGEEARVVGGAVRNALLGLPPGDIDVATTATPDVVTAQAQAAGMKAVPTGVDHGTVTVVVDHHPFEVTTLREDIETDGRRAVVEFGRDFARDAARRDFTMNALYAAPDGTVIDLVGGLPDLAARRVRFIGDAETRIREDYLRILRLFRFHSEYGEGQLDQAALTAAVRLRAGLAQLSSERIRAELLKLLASRRAAETVPAIAENGFLDRLLATAPDLSAFAAVSASGADPVLRLAALAVRVREDAGALHERLRLSNAEALRLEKAARVLEMAHGRLKSMTGHNWRVEAYRHGDQAARDGLALAGARCFGLRAQEALREARSALAQPAPKLPWSGRDALARGVAPGPQVGALLARAEALWIAGDFPADPDALAAIFDAAVAHSSAAAGTPLN